MNKYANNTIESPRGGSVLEMLMSSLQIGAGNTEIEKGDGKDMVFFPPKP